MDTNNTIRVCNRSAPVENPGRVFVNFLVGGSMCCKNKMKVHPFCCFYFNPFFNMSLNFVPPICMLWSQCCIYEFYLALSCHLCLQFSAEQQNFPVEPKSGLWLQWKAFNVIRFITLLLKKLKIGYYNNYDIVMKNVLSQSDHTKQLTLNL
jgi:hypothetical protein